MIQWKISKISRPSTVCQANSVSIDFLWVFYSAACTHTLYACAHVWLSTCASPCVSSHIPSWFMLSHPDRCHAARFVHNVRDSHPSRRQSRQGGETEELTHSVHLAHTSPLAAPLATRCLLTPRRSEQHVDSHLYKAIVRHYWITLWFQPSFVSTEHSITYRVTEWTILSTSGQRCLALNCFIKRREASGSNAIVGQRLCKREWGWPS